MKAYSLLISTFLSLMIAQAQDRQNKELRKDLDQPVARQLETVAPGCVVLVPLFAKSQAVFFLKVIEAEIEFTKDDSNNVTQLIARYGGKKRGLKKK